MGILISRRFQQKQRKKENKKKNTQKEKSFKTVPSGARCHEHDVAGEKRWEICHQASRASDKCTATTRPYTSRRESPAAQRSKPPPAAADREPTHREDVPLQPVSKWSHCGLKGKTRANPCATYARISDNENSELLAINSNILFMAIKRGEIIADRSKTCNKGKTEVQRVSLLGESSHCLVTTD